MDRYTFDDGRVYTDGVDWMPSVSQVLNERPKPQGLINWEENTSKDEREQKKFYTQNRGTLIHYHLLSELTNEEYWSDDEQNSQDCLKGKKEHSETGITGDYETWHRFQNEKEWAKEAWSVIRKVYGIHPENTLDVELYVKNTDVGYAGQFDLLYFDEDKNDVVLADIKTSKRVYDKHLIQAVAYSHAVEIPVDRMEIIRINPDSKTWEISSSEDWIESKDELWEEFVSLRKMIDDEHIQNLKKKAQNV